MQKTAQHNRKGYIYISKLIKLLDRKKKKALPDKQTGSINFMFQVNCGHA